MSVRVIRIDDLDPNDPRRWTKPTGNDDYARLCARLWEKGLIAADLGEWLRVTEKRCGKKPPGPSDAELKRNYGRWLPRTIRVCSNDDDARAPSKTIDNNAEQYRNYGCWLPRQVRAPVKRKAYDSVVVFSTNERAPSKRRAMGVYANDSDAQPCAGSACFTGCNCCGITHSHRLCPNRVQRASVTDPKSAVRTDNSSFQT